VVGKNSAATSFFRIPGFLRRHEVENYLQSRHLMTWSADVVADDWRHINASEVVRRAISRLDEKGKGILLLHDIQPATALALPELLRELKNKGYRIVHVVPRGKGDTSVPVAAKPAPVPAEVAAIDVTATSVPAPTTPPVAKPAPALVAIVPPPMATTAAKPTAALAVATPTVAALQSDDAEVAPAKTSLPAPAADSLARGEDVTIDPVRPFTSGSRPSRNMPTPDKFVTSEPGGWPPIVSVPVPRAGGIGVSSRAGVSQTPDGRFQER
jgi:hypothetical protein